MEMHTHNNGKTRYQVLTDFTQNPKRAYIVRTFEGETEKDTICVMQARNQRPAVYRQEGFTWEKCGSLKAQNIEDITPAQFNHLFSL